MYTKSKDGKFRTNLHFKIRLTKEELAELNKMAQFLNRKNFRDYVTHELFLLIENINLEYEGKKEFEAKFGVRE